MSESAQTFRDTKTRKVLALGEIVAGVVGRHPVRNRIDVQLHFLRTLRFTNQHLAWGNQAGDELKLCVVQMKCFAVEFAIHLRVGQKDLRWAALRDDMQHARFLEFLEGLGRKDHCCIVLAPGLLRLDNVIADGLIADKQPCFVDQKRFEGTKLRGICDFIARPVQDIEQ